MNKFFQSYNIEFSLLEELLVKSGALVAGSFSLAGYLTQEGINVNYQPGDVDIFINAYSDEFRPLLSLIESHGYKKDRIVDYYDNESSYYNCLEYINTVTSLVNDDGKKIQVVAVRSNNILQYIKSNFDLSICISWWDSSTQSFQTLFPEETRNMEMRVMRTNISITKLNARIEKYRSRGFKLAGKLVKI